MERILNRIPRVALPALLLLLAIAGAALAQDLTANSLNALNSALDAGWTAGNTSVSDLPKAEQQRRLGGLPENATVNDISPLAVPLPDVPAAFSWRSKDGLDYVTPIRNQGNCGSCFVFAPVAALESKLRIAAAEALSLDLAEQIVLSCSSAGNCAAGGYASTVSTYLYSTGTAAETCYPYTQTDGDCSNSCANWQATPYKFTANWIQVNAGQYPSANLLKNAIYTYGPIVLWMNVSEDFYYYTSGVYQYTTGASGGGHFILAYGWDDAQSALLCKNSWGTTWGEAGFFRINYSQLSSSRTMLGYWAYGYGPATGPNVNGSGTDAVPAVNLMLQ